MEELEDCDKKKYDWLMHIISLGITLIIKIIKKRRERKLKK